MLTTNVYKTVLEIIDLAHSVPDQAAMFRAVCVKLQRLVGFNSACFIPLDGPTRKLHTDRHL